MLVKQFGKPKSTGNVFDNDQDKTDTGVGKSLSSDKSYLTDESGTGTDKSSTDDKSQDKDSELK
jgi:hypothetical protein